jgi:hypothetical protein
MLNTLNAIQYAAVVVFPDVKERLSELMAEGYSLNQFVYESKVPVDHDSIEFILKKDGNSYELSQAKGHYAGGFSHLVFKKLS